MKITYCEQIHPLVMATHRISFFVLYTSIFLTTLPFLAAQTWQSTPMHGGGFVVGITPHPSDAHTVFANIDVGGIYKSTNKGDNWESITKSIPLASQRNFQVRSMNIDPTNADNIYFLTGNAAFSGESHFYWTNDGGTTWQQEETPTHFSGNHFGRYAGKSILLHPNDSNKIYIAGQPYYNNGAWVEAGGIFVSDNKGSTWTKLDDGTFNKAWINSIKFKPNDPNKLLIAGSILQEPWMSTPTNNEGLWEYDLTTQAITQLKTGEIFDFDFDTGNPNTIIALWTEGIYVTTDYGASWTTKTPFAGYSYRYFVTPHPTKSGHWFFGSWDQTFRNGLIETTDGGTTFSEVKYFQGTNRTKLNYPSYEQGNYTSSFGNSPSTLVFSQDNSTAYVGDWYGVWRTEDVAANLSNGNATNTENANWAWTWATQGIYSLVQMRIAKHPTIPGQFYNCVADIGYYKMWDYGKEREHFTAIPISSVYKMAFHPSNPDIGYCIGKQHNGKGRITKTIDGGDNWFEPRNGQQYGLSFFEENDLSYTTTDIVIAGNSAESLIIGLQKQTATNQIYRSDDQGVTFYPWDEGITGKDLFREWTHQDCLEKSADGTTFYAYSENYLFKRGIDDASWVRIPEPAGSGRWIGKVTPHPTLDNVVYLTHYRFGIFKSTDYGATWMNLPIVGVANKNLAISPNGQQLLVLDAGDFNSNRPQSIYYTNDEGQDWDTLTTEGILTPLVGIEYLDNTHLIGWTEGTGSVIYNFNSQTIQYTEDNSDFVNPERGFYRYSATDSDNYSVLNATELAGYRNLHTPFSAGYQVYSSLVFRYFRLQDFVNVPITQSYLDNMQLDFDAARTAGVKLIPRFTYTTTYNGSAPYGDATKARILEHIAQIKPILQANKDVIATLQMGFIGVWGEQYYTDHFGFAGDGPLTATNIADRNEVLNALLDAIPSDRMVQARIPQYKQKAVYGTNASINTAALTDNEAFDGSNKARIGHHNDCFLTTEADYGTYLDLSNNNDDSGVINTLKNYLEADSKYTVMGGETCADLGDRSNCMTDPNSGDADTEMRRFHYSYLNSQYNNEVNDDWIPYCMEDIKKSLGYRFVLTSGTYPATTSKGDSVTIEINLKNVGYAAPFNPRKVELILRNTTNTNELFTVTLADDPRLWLPNSEVNIQQKLCMGYDIPVGTYDLFLNLPDPEPTLHDRPAYAIRLANTNVWEAATGYNLLANNIIVTEKEHYGVCTQDLVFGQKDCGTKLLLPNTSLPDGIYASVDNLTASTVIAAESNITFQANNSITLKAGFSAIAGSSFLAKIDNCILTTLQEKEKENESSNEQKQGFPNHDIAIQQIAKKLSEFTVYPNPFQQTTTIVYEVQQKGLTQLQLFDFLGRPVKLLVNEVQNTGLYEYSLNLPTLISGTYFLCLQQNKSVQVKKLVVN